MTNEEAYKKAYEYCSKEKWEPIYAFEIPMRISWFIIRINQLFNHTGIETENYKEFLKLEKEMKKNESNNV